MRCPTTHGPHQCRMNAGHPGECENDPGLGPRLGRVVSLDLDAQRELAKAGRRIEALEAALRVIRTFACEAKTPEASCECCRRFREFASGALGGKS
jgi:hypothetical protein